MAVPASALYEIVDELDTGASGTPFDAEGHREYVRKFMVRTRLKGLAAEWVCSAPGIPLPFSPYMSANGLEYDLLALLTSLSAEQSTDDWPQWIVTAKYSTRMPAGYGPQAPHSPNVGQPHQQKGSQNNPELEPPDIFWDWEVMQKAWPFDLNRIPFTTSCGMPMSPAPTFEAPCPVLHIVRNELNFDWEIASFYAFSVNDDDFLGGPPETVLCYPPSAKWTTRGALPYWRVSYRFKFSTSTINEPGETDTWQPHFLDASTYQLVDGKSVPIRRAGNPITRPVLLDGHGQELQKDKDGKLKPVYNTFNVYRKRSLQKLIEKGVGPLA